ncbi:MAG: hypothetical protein M1308_03485 [Actinobacteria bacterium]|nr:hypothetical protein [Actinomycetota bacterium]
MISNAFEWKKDIKKDLDQFKTYISEKKAGSKEHNVQDDLYFITLEKFFFNTALAIRKLREANCLSKFFSGLKIPVIQYPEKEWSSKLDKSSAHSIYWEYQYDKNKGQKISIDIDELVNLLIHSFIFQEKHNIEFPRQLNAYLIDGIYVNSENKSKYLYFIKITTYFELLYIVIENNLDANASVAETYSKRLEKSYTKEHLIIDQESKDRIKDKVLKMEQKMGLERPKSYWLKIPLTIEIECTCEKHISEIRKFNLYTCVMLLKNQETEVKTAILDNNPMFHEYISEIVKEDICLGFIFQISHNKNTCPALINEVSVGKKIDYLGSKNYCRSVFFYERLKSKLRALK